MENIQHKRGMENPIPAVSKIDRLQQRAQRLQQEAQQARERVREEAALQEKLARLKERQRIEKEVVFSAPSPGLRAWPSSEVSGGRHQKSRRP